MEKKSMINKTSFKNLKYLWKYKTIMPEIINIQNVACKKFF